MKPLKFSIFFLYLFSSQIFASRLELIGIKCLSYGCYSYKTFTTETEKGRTFIKNEMRENELKNSAITDKAFRYSLYISFINEALKNPDIMSRIKKIETTSNEEVILFYDYGDKYLYVNLGTHKYSKQDRIYFGDLPGGELYHKTDEDLSRLKKAIIPAIKKKLYNIYSHMSPTTHSDDNIIAECKGLFGTFNFEDKGSFTIKKNGKIIFTYKEVISSWGEVIESGEISSSIGHLEKKSGNTCSVKYNFSEVAQELNDSLGELNLTPLSDQKVKFEFSESSEVFIGTRNSN